MCASVFKKSAIKTLAGIHHVEVFFPYIPKSVQLDWERTKIMKDNISIQCLKLRQIILDYNQ